MHHAPIPTGVIELTGIGIGVGVQWPKRIGQFELFADDAQKAIEHAAFT